VVKTLRDRKDLDDTIDLTQLATHWAQRLVPVVTFIRRLRFDGRSTAIRLLIEGHYSRSDVTHQWLLTR